MPVSLTFYQIPTKEPHVNHIFRFKTYRPKYAHLLMFNARCTVDPLESGPFPVKVTLGDPSHVKGTLGGPSHVIRPCVDNICLSHAHRIHGILQRFIHLPRFFL